LTAYWWVTPESNPSLPIEWRLVDGSGGIVDSRESNIATEFPSRHGSGAGLADRPALLAAHVTLEPPRKALPGTYHIVVAEPGSPAGEVVGRVHVKDWERLSELPQIANQSEARLAGGAIALRGFEVATQAEAQQGLDVRVLWQAESAIEDDWKVFVHLLDEDGKLVAQSDGFPADGIRRTDGWARGEVIEDRYHVSLPHGLAGGRYELLIGLYDPVTGVRAPVEGGAGPDTVLLAIVDATGDSVHVDHPGP
jgi:hypothetical protein